MRCESKQARANFESYAMSQPLRGVNRPHFTVPTQGQERGSVFRKLGWNAYFAYDLNLTKRLLLQEVLI